jgi:hypothetical protein
MWVRKALILSFLVLLSIATPASPLPLPPGSVRPLNTAAEIKSVSGQVSSVAASPFYLETFAGQKSNTLQFLVDENRKREGQLIIGLQATVTYRVVEEELVATGVTITPGPGIFSVSV